MITCLCPDDTVKTTPLLIVNGPTEKPFCPVAIVRLVDTLSAFINTPLAATTDVVPVTTVPVTAAGVDPPITDALIVDAPEIATPVNVPPVIATLLAFWDAIVPKPLISPEAIVSHTGAADAEPVPVWFKNFLVAVVLPDSFVSVLVAPE
jgi:hypothetical protein